MYYVVVPSLAELNYFSTSSVKMSLFAGVKREIDVKASIKDQSGKTIKVNCQFQI